MVSEYLTQHSPISFATQQLQQQPRRIQPVRSLLLSRNKDPATDQYHNSERGTVYITGYFGIKRMPQTVYNGKSI